MIFNQASYNGIYELDIKYRGNKILSAYPRFDQCERGILELIKGRSALKILPFLERIDPYCSYHYSTCFTLMIEQALGIKITENLKATRTTLLELERILSHTYYLKRIVNLIDNTVLSNISATIKDMVIDLTEEISGRRIFAAANYFGGLNLTLSQGNVKLIQETCERILSTVKEFHGIFFHNPSLRSLLEKQACINNNTAAKMTGPFSWIFGNNNDLRVTDPYLSYESTPIRSILNTKFKSNSNCIYSRSLAIIDDIKTSLGIINSLIANNDITYFNQELLMDSLKLPSGEYRYKIETPRGILTLTLSDDIKAQTPTETNMISVNNALNGCKLDETDIAFESLYLSPMEASK